MKKKNRKYLIAIIIGVLLTPSAISYAAEQRQYFAIGGEWLLIPLCLAIVVLGQSLKDIIQETRSLWEDEEL